jgi:CheY-like chemotaxis protein
LFEQTEIASYQSAHDVSRPLDCLSKSRRQAVLSEVCAKLLRTAQTQELNTSAYKIGTYTARQSGPQNILIVEDEEPAGPLLRMILERAGYSVNLVCDGEAGLERVRKDRPDLMVLDWNLPKLSGLDVLREVRRDPTLDGLRVLFLSGYASETDRVVALELGADDFVPKPARAEELVARVRGLLRRSVRHVTP